MTEPNISGQDQAILELLENDARLNAQDLADILNEDAKDVAHAVRRMEDQKIIPEIDSLYLITGDNDFICLVQGRTMFEVCQFVADRIAVMEHVQSTKTLFVLKQYKQSGVLTGAARTANSEGRLVVSY